MSLNETPRASRLHIGLFGLRNAGKSSLVNALAGHDVAIVAPQAGTTTDPVYKSMEIHPLGPCVLIDTAGVDDTGSLGGMRVERTAEALDKTDVALVVLNRENLQEPAISRIREWVGMIEHKKIPYLPVLNKADTLTEEEKAETLAAFEALLQKKPVLASALTGEGVQNVLDTMIRIVPAEWDAHSLTGSLAQEGSLVLLVMPQDIQAPKGRLILPQVQVMRDLLDKKCVIMSVTADKLEEGLAALKTAPDLIITDSQVFGQVYEKKPEQSLLTSFSILLAAHKGDIHILKEGAKALAALTENSQVLIAEACTHAPLSEDIGREKIPAMLRKRTGPGLKVDIVSGSDFPADLSGYDIIIHCGACMFNRKYMMGRIMTAQEQNVPITNYGTTLAWLGGILDKVSLP